MSITCWLRSFKAIFNGSRTTGQFRQRLQLEVLEDRVVPSGMERINNGDFEAGHTGFTSDYSTSPANTWPEGTLAVVHNPHGIHRLAADYRDHTSQSGMMLVVNGAVVGNAVVWSQDGIRVSPDGHYVFAMALSNWTPTSPAALEVTINGKVIGTFSAAGRPGAWQGFSATWDAGDSKAATIRIVDRNGAAFGNDFALDDLSFQPAPGEATFAINGNASTAEGDNYSLQLRSDDRQPVRWSINWGDGTVEQIKGSPNTVHHVYADGPNQYAISATAHFADGSTADVTPLNVTVNDVAPILQLHGEPFVGAGLPYKLGLVSNDPGTDRISSWSINWGDGTTDTVQGNPSNATHVYTKAGQYEIKASATNEDDTYDVESLEIAVTNGNLTNG